MLVHGNQSFTGYLVLGFNTVSPSGSGLNGASQLTLLHSNDGERTPVRSCRFPWHHFNFLCERPSDPYYAFIHTHTIFENSHISFTLYCMIYSFCQVWVGLRSSIWTKQTSVNLNLCTFMCRPNACTGSAKCIWNISDVSKAQLEYQDIQSIGFSHYITFVIT